MRYLLLLTMTVILLSACITNTYNYGTIKYVEEDGGFYGIQGASGGRYIPTNLPGDYKEDGLEIEYTYEELQYDVISDTVYEWGKIINLTHIERDE